MGSGVLSSAIGNVLHTVFVPSASRAAAAIRPAIGASGAVFGLVALTYVFVLCAVFVFLLSLCFSVLLLWLCFCFFNLF